MFKNPLKRLFGGKDDGSGPPNDHKALLACFGYLDQLGAGTAERVVAFIQTGAGRTILPDLQAKKIQVAEALHA